MYATALTKTAPAVQTLLEKGEGGSHTHKSGSGVGGGEGCSKHFDKQNAHDSHNAYNLQDKRTCYHPYRS